MSIEIQFGTYAKQNNETLIQRIQFVYSPLNELFRSMHVLLNPRHHGMHIDWALQSQDKLSNQMYNDLQYFSLLYELGVPPVFLNNLTKFSANLNAELQALEENLRATDTQVIVEKLQAVLTARENNFIPELAKGLEWGDFSLSNSSELINDLQTSSDKVYDRLFSFIANYRKIIFDDIWSSRNIQSFLIDEIEEQTKILRINGFRTLVNNLQIDRMHWKDKSLIITKPFNDLINLKDNGVIALIPSFFVWPHLFVDRWHGGVAITYGAFNRNNMKIAKADFVKIFNALSDSTRIQILDYLSTEKSTTQSLAQIMIMSPSSISRHLQILKEARLVNNEKNGKFVLYTVNPLLTQIIPHFFSFTE